MEQLDYLPLGPRRGIAIIQVVDRTLVVAVSEQRTELLVELEGDPARMTAHASNRDGPITAPPTLPQFAGSLIRQWKQSRAGSSRQ